MLFPHHRYGREIVAGLAPKPAKQGIRARLRREYDEFWWTLFFIWLAVSLAAASNRKK